jgi:hypothetical protein
VTRREPSPSIAKVVTWASIGRTLGETVCRICT